MKTLTDWWNENNIKDEINLLRAEHSLPARTNQQIIDAIDAKLATLSKYNWMS